MVMPLFHVRHILTKEEKKSNIRKNIIEASEIYSKNLAGKVFLYIYGNEFFEVSFPVNRFLHLTGVNTLLNAKEFYKRARKSELTNKQFFFDSRNTYHNSKKKLPCLQRLPELTNKEVCILRDTHTATITYKLSVTNLELILSIMVGTYISKIFVATLHPLKHHSIVYV